MKYLIKININIFEEKVLENIVIDGPEVVKKPIYIESSKGKILLIGDCINLSENIGELEKGKPIETVISSLNGNFHLYYFDRIDKKFFVYNSLWGIIPLYYKIEKDVALFSSSLNLIKKETNSCQINKKYLLQTVIFNYSLCNDTFWNGISLLPVNSFIELSKNTNLKIKKYFFIEEHFSQNPKGGRNALNHLSDLFISETAKWFPKEKFAISFTGGFDGRTLVSVAKYFNQNFFTYSFGNNGASDLELPKLHAKDMGIEFREIRLDKSYAENYYHDHLSDIILNSEGRAGINRSHYNYAADFLKKYVRYILTGNFGSEILRSLHITGALFSKAMFLVINYSNDDSTWIAGIESLPEFRLLDKKYFHHEWEETIYDIKQIIKHSNNLEKNLWTYKFVFEEVFRKYFGAEIFMQYNYLINRTPFLNIIFLKELLKTKYAGAYGPFFTHNPVYRLKGQLFYASVISKTSPYLYNVTTDKGYKPKDLLTKYGYLKLVLNYLKKNISSVSLAEKDPFSVIYSFNKNKNIILSLNSNNPFFQESIIQDYLYGNNSEKIGFAIRILSLIHYLKSEGYNGEI